MKSIMRENNVIPFAPRRRFGWLHAFVWRLISPVWQPGRFLSAKGENLDALGRAWNTPRRWLGREPDSMYRARITRAMHRQTVGITGARFDCAVCGERLKSFEAGPACRRCGGP